jgi:uncharacterized membrane protein YbhN (UPF0104 family)
MKKHLAIIVKLTISLGFIYWLFTTISTTEIIFSLANANLTYLLIAGVIFNTRVLLFGQRWKLLLKNYNSNVSAVLTTQLHFVGIFCNNFFPGSIGGDFVRGLALKKESVSMPTIISTILIERVYGVLSLLLIALVSFFVSFKLYPFFTPGYTGSLLLSIVTISFCLIILFIVFKKRIYGLASKMHLDIRRGIEKSAMKIGLYSFVIQLLGILAISLLGLSVGSTIDFYYYLVLCPIVIIISMVPISLNGLGVRESSFVFFFSYVGMDKNDAASIAILWLLLFYSQCIFGLYYFLKLKLINIVNEDKK